MAGQHFPVSRYIKGGEIREAEKDSIGKLSCSMATLTLNLHLDKNYGSFHIYFDKNYQDESMLPLGCGFTESF